MLAFILAAALSMSDRAPGDHAVLKGRVVVVTRTAEAVVIGLDEDKDGFADDLFWFFSSPGPSVAFQSENASVDFRGNELVIISGETGELIGFSAGEPRLTRRELARDSASSFFAGYGLAHRMGPGVRRIYMPLRHGGKIQTTDTCDYSPDDCIYNLDPGGGGGGGSSCTSGGVGAISCSVRNTSGNECSIQCASGYYACCVNCQAYGCTPTCSCVKN